MDRENHGLPQAQVTFTVKDSIFLAQVIYVSGGD